MVSYAMIPARHGSKRLPLKNLALIDGSPLISYAIQAAQESASFDRVIVNGDHDVFHSVAEEYGAEFYKRPPELGSDLTRSDHVVADFVHSFPEADTVAWVNPIAPLQGADEIATVMTFFFQEGLDSLITTQHRHVHVQYKSTPLNFDPNGLFDRTQDLEPVEMFVYSMMVWDTRTFKREFEIKDGAIFCGSFGTYPASAEASIIVKTKEDLQLIERMLEVRRAGKSPVTYDPRADVLLR